MSFEEQLNLLEINLHDLGYRYTGKESVYGLTWIEIFRIMDGLGLKSEQKELIQSGARRSDLKKFEEFQKKQRQKQG